MDEKITEYFNDPEIKETLANMFELTEEEREEFLENDYTITKS